ncbi:hypothetical protein QF037_007519 [Streptomyces canus]|nr:hypothetical protein [Streptomyces canus]
MPGGRSRRERDRAAGGTDPLRGVRYARRHRRPPSPTAARAHRPTPRPAGSRTRRPDGNRAGTAHRPEHRRAPPSRAWRTDGCQTRAVSRRVSSDRAQRTDGCLASAVRRRASSDRAQGTGEVVWRGVRGGPGGRPGRPVPGGGGRWSRRTFPGVWRCGAGVSRGFRGCPGRGPGACPGSVRKPSAGAGSRGRGRRRTGRAGGGSGEACPGRYHGPVPRSRRAGAKPRRSRAPYALPHPMLGPVAVPRWCPGCARAPRGPWPRSPSSEGSWGVGVPWGAEGWRRAALPCSCAPRFPCARVRRGARCEQARPGTHTRTDGPASPDSGPCRPHMRARHSTGCPRPDGNQSTSPRL